MTKNTRSIMQHICFGFVLALGFVTAQAQSTTATTTLTKQERAAATQYLEATRKKFLTAIQGLSEAQLKFKAAPDRWSVAEVAEHIALSEDLLFDLVTKQILNTPAAPDKKALVQGKDELVRKNVIDRTTKVQAPEQFKPSNKWASQKALVQAFKTSRANTIQFIKSTQTDLRSHIAPHPVFKELDAYQWILLLAGHSERHTLQILEVKADPNFPKK